MNAEAQRETLEFQAEVRQILDLMIHSLYSNREIFLRELISNASDAADRLRFEALQNEALWEDDPDPAIRLGVDSEAGTLTISDNGIGMTPEEMEQLGTIYFRSDHDRVNEYKGSGLGIPIAYGLIEQLGGSIHVESEHGVGTRFTVIMPGAN